MDRIEPLKTTARSLCQHRERYLIVEFEDEQNRPYFMIVNKDLSQSFRFHAECAGKLLRLE